MHVMRYHRYKQAASTQSCLSAKTSTGGRNMKKSTILATVATLGLVTAAAAPALAFENEFHGSFTAQFINSNFNGTDVADPNTAYYAPAGLSKSQTSANFVEQRARLQYIGKASNDLKLVTTFELDYSYWGNSSYNVQRNGGGAIGADSINLETKSIYLDFNPAKGYNVKLGMMPNTDAFKGVIFDTDMAGALVAADMGKFSPSFGVFRFSDDSSSSLGTSTRDMLMLDAKYQISNSFKLGGAYYLTRDETAGSDIKMNILGLNAAYTAGDLSLSGFAIYETGSINNTDVNSFAANLGAAMKVGPGTARAELLYVQGSDDGKNDFYSIAGEHGFYNNEMVILGRDKNAMTTDNSIIYNVGNEGQGQMGLYLGYDLPVTEKLTTAFNVGFASIAEKNGTGNDNNSKYLGTEINAEATYTVLKGLTAGVRAGYVMLGGYYDDVALNNDSPANPYDVKLMVKYSF
jgi:hypothetical protein